MGSDPKTLQKLKIYDIIYTQFWKDLTKKVKFSIFFNTKLKKVISFIFYERNLISKKILSDDL